MYKQKQTIRFHIYNAGNIFMAEGGAKLYDTIWVLEAIDRNLITLCNKIEDRVETWAQENDSIVPDITIDFDLSPIATSDWDDDNDDDDDDGEDSCS